MNIPVALDVFCIKVGGDIDSYITGDGSTLSLGTNPENATQFRVVEVFDEFSALQIESVSNPANSLVIPTASDATVVAGGIGTIIVSQLLYDTVVSISQVVTNEPPFTQSFLTTDFGTRIFGAAATTATFWQLRKKTDIVPTPTPPVGGGGTVSFTPAASEFSNFIVRDFTKTADNFFAMTLLSQASNEGQGLAIDANDILVVGAAQILTMFSVDEPITATSTFFISDGATKFLSSAPTPTFSTVNPEVFQVEFVNGNTAVANGSVIRIKSVQSSLGYLSVDGGTPTPTPTPGIAVTEGNLVVFKSGVSWLQSSQDGILSATAIASEATLFQVSYDSAQFGQLDQTIFAIFTIPGTTNGFKLSAGTATIGQDPLNGLVFVNGPLEFGKPTTISAGNPLVFLDLVDQNITGGSAMTQWTVQLGFGIPPTPAPTPTQTPTPAPTPTQTPTPSIPGPPPTPSEVVENPRFKIQIPGTLSRSNFPASSATLGDNYGSAVVYEPWAIATLSNLIKAGRAQLVATRKTEKLAFYILKFNLVDDLYLPVGDVCVPYVGDGITAKETDAVSVILYNKEPQYLGARIGSIGSTEYAHLANNKSTRDSTDNDDWSFYAARTTFLRANPDNVPLGAFIGGSSGSALYTRYGRGDGAEYAKILPHKKYLSALDEYDGNPYNINVFISNVAGGTGSGASRIPWISRSTTFNTVSVFGTDSNNTADYYTEDRFKTYDLKFRDTINAPTSLTAGSLIGMRTFNGDYVVDFSEAGQGSLELGASSNIDSGYRQFTVKSAETTSASSMNLTASVGTSFISAAVGVVKSLSLSPTEQAIKCNRYVYQYLGNRFEQSVQLPTTGSVPEIVGTDVASILQTNSTSYNMTVTNFNRPADDVTIEHEDDIQFKMTAGSNPVAIGGLFVGSGDSFLWDETRVTTFRIEKYEPTNDDNFTKISEAFSLLVTDKTQTPTSMDRVGRYLAIDSDTGKLTTRESKFYWIFESPDVWNSPHTYNLLSTTRLKFLADKIRLRAATFVKDERGFNLRSSETFQISTVATQGVFYQAGTPTGGVFDFVTGTISSGKVDRIDSLFTIETFPFATEDADDTGLSTGALIGIIIGVIAAIAIAAVLIWYFMRRAKLARSTTATGSMGANSQEY